MTIGGGFNLPLSVFSKNKKRELDNNLTYLSSGRDCINYIIGKIDFGNDYVLLPSYLCPSIIDPFKKNKVKIAYYKILENLELDIVDLKFKLERFKVKSILLIHYFGFIQPHIEDIKKLCQKNNVVLIEDIVQSSLSDYKPMGDYYFNSYRKIFPMPDGAAVFSKIKSESGNNLRSFTFSSSKFICLILNNYSIFRPVINQLLSHLEMRSVLSDKPVRMSSISKFIYSRLELGKIKKQRKENYNFLLNKLKGVETIFGVLPENIIPLGFPILLKDKIERDSIRKFLNSRKIFCPIHWKISTDINKAEFRESREISERILTIPIDQRYKNEHLEFIVKELSSVI